MRFWSMPSQYGSDKPPNPLLGGTHNWAGDPSSAEETSARFHPQFWGSKIDRSPPELGDLAARYGRGSPAHIIATRQGAIRTIESINRTVLNAEPLSLDFVQQRFQAGQVWVAVDRDDV